MHTRRSGVVRRRLGDPPPRCWNAFYLVGAEGKPGAVEPADVAWRTAGLPRSWLECSEPGAG
jgi:hypothetical protein